MISDAFIEALYIVGGYLMLFVAMVMSINHLMKGSFFVWLRVRASRGKKVMVTFFGAIDKYWRVGEIREGALKTTDKAGEKRTYTGITADMFHNMLGVMEIEIDEVRNCLFTRTGAGVVGNDPNQVDSLLERALKKPQNVDVWQKIAIFAILVMIIGLAVLAWLVFDNNALIGQLIEDFASKTTVTGGVV